MLAAVVVAGTAVVVAGTTVAVSVAAAVLVAVVVAVAVAADPGQGVGVRSGLTGLVLGVDPSWATWIGWLEKGLVQVVVVAVAT
jgi:hypothetical protein